MPYRLHPVAANARPAKTKSMVLLCRAIVLAAKHDARAAIVLPVAPGPVDHHAQAVTETDQKKDMDRKPEAPGERAGQTHAAQLDHRGPASDRRERAIIAITKRRCCTPRQPVLHDARNVDAHLLRRGRNA